MSDCYKGMELLFWDVKMFSISFGAKIGQPRVNTKTH